MVDLDILKQGGNLLYNTHNHANQLENILHQLNLSYLWKLISLELDPSLYQHVNQSVSIPVDGLFLLVNEID